MTELDNSVIGVGADIESVKRFKARPYDPNKEFYSKIFNKAEINLCLSKPDTYQSFAARFAAKESIIKCASQLTKLSFNDVEISENKDKFPEVKIKKKGFRKFKVKISMSHTDEYAVAFAILTN